MKDVAGPEAYREAWKLLREKFAILAAEEDLSVETMEKMTRILERLLKSELLAQSMERRDPAQAPDVDVTMEGVD